MSDQNAISTQVNRVRTGASDRIDCALIQVSSMTAHMVTSELQNVTLEGRQLNVLEMLTASPSDHVNAMTLREIMDELAADTEKNSKLAALIWRFAGQRTKPLWESHPSEECRTEKGFLLSLEYRDIVTVLLNYGKTCGAAKQSSDTMIKEQWGPDWWESVPEDMKGPKGHKRDVPKSWFVKIARLSRTTTLETAITQWRQAIKDRTDMDRRDRLRIHWRSHQPHLQLCDIADPEEWTRDEDGVRDESAIAVEDHTLVFGKKPQKRKTPPGGAESGGSRPRKRRRKDNVLVGGTASRPDAIGTNVLSCIEAEAREGRESEGDDEENDDLQGLTKCWVGDGKKTFIDLAKIWRDRQGKGICGNCHRVVKDQGFNVERLLEKLVGFIRGLDEMHFCGELMTKSQLFAQTQEPTPEKSSSPTSVMAGDRRRPLHVSSPVQSEDNEDDEEPVEDSSPRRSEDGDNDDDYGEEMVLPDDAYM